MNYRIVTSIAGLAALLMPLHTHGQNVPSSAAAQRAPAVAPRASAAKPWTAPKTPWGDPDLQGVWTSDDCIGTPLNRPAELGEKLYWTEEEIAQREAQIARQAEADRQETVADNARVTTGPPGHWGERARRPCRQTSLVVDPPNGRAPDFLPEARMRRTGAFQPAQPASWEDFTYYIRCISRGVAGSIFPVIYGNGQHIVQAPGFVSILQEMVHEARVIPLDGRPHAGPNIRSYMGDARGHWEGDTLVVETTNFVGGTTGIGPNGQGTPTSEALKLTERFTRVDPSTINYQITIDDPKTYTRPWTVAFPLTQEPGYENFEYACHEGNHAMFNSLSGARALEEAAKTAK